MVGKLRFTAVFSAKLGILSQPSRPGRQSTTLNISRPPSPKGRTTEIISGSIWALPVGGGGGLTPCLDGLGHFLYYENHTTIQKVPEKVPQSAPLSGGRGPNCYLSNAQIEEEIISVVRP